MVGILDKLICFDNSSKGGVSTRFSLGSMKQALTALQSFSSLGTVCISVGIHHWVSQQALSQRKGYSNRFVKEHYQVEVQEKYFWT